MLTELRIENLGVIESLELVLTGGLTVLTGETGAGKTMLVEAIELLVGGRADASVVRQGATEARVDGRFVVGESETVLSRVVPSLGRSRAYVDGRPTTVSALSEITDRLVDLHGQHAHQSLLSGSTQREALDRFAGVDLGPLRQAKARVLEVEALLAQLGGDARTRAREIDLLKFQIAELDAAGITDPGEGLELAELEELLADSFAHRLAGTECLGLLDEERAARDNLALALQALGERSPFASLAARVAGVLAEVDDVITDLRTAVENIEHEPARLDQVRARRHLLSDLCRKYGDDLDAVMAFHTQIEQRLAVLEGDEARIAELEGQLAEAVRAQLHAATVVGDRRRAAADTLAEAVQAGLHHLAMGRAVVEVKVADRHDDLAGEQVEFLLAANPGSPLLPLNRVASGGELARSMLALRLALLGRREREDAEPGDTTLVFDEVDAGIGGAAALAVAQSLFELAGHHQVLVVTHLAQVAAVADQQILVTKTVTGSSTAATACEVTAAERIDELARMLSGEVSAVARDHARELMSRSAPSGGSAR